MGETDNRDKTTRGNILRETIDLIRSNRLSTLTVRQICKSADANVGAINYYFGDKDNLLHIAAREILQSIKENFLPLDNLDLPPKERLRLFLVTFADNQSIYLDCIRWMASKKDLTFKSSFEYSAYLKDIGFEKVNATMSEITGETDHMKLRVLSIQLLCAAIGPNFATPSVSHSELPTVQEQIDILLTHFFSKN